MHPFSKHRQWNAVEEVCQKLKASGHQALLAGGCVRDLIMNREPNDFDIASDATPDQVGALFPNALLVGREFGVTIIPYDGFQIEVATFRVDGSYKDGRRPDSVMFSTPEEDAKRRDFTVNALFFDIGTNQVIDFVNGQADIKGKLIRAVGDAKKRFTEDKLRLLRAVRFAAQLDFEIEPKTLQSVNELAQEVSLVSFERIREELTKLLKTKNAGHGLKLLRETKLLDVVLPEFSAQLASNEMSKKVEQEINGGSSSLELAWMKFFFHLHPTNEILKAITKRLKFSNQEIDALLWLQKNSALFLETNPRVDDPKLIRALANPHARLAEEFFGQHTSPEAKKIWAQIHSSSLQNSKTLPTRFLNGDQLQALGLAKGPKLGQLMEEIYDLQLSGKLKDEPAARAHALEWIKLNS